MGDNEIPDEYMARRSGCTKPPATLNDTWGYKSFDNNWKPADQTILALNAASLNERGVNYLLNVGPDYAGPHTRRRAVDILRKAGQIGG